jgi:hypothetical protein
MALDDYDPSTALTAYYTDRDERRTARLWATEKLLHDLRAVGIIDFFEGAGSDPTAFDGYASTKLWLRVSSGVTDAPGQIRQYDGAGDESLLSNWPLLAGASLASFIDAFSLSQHTSDNITEGVTKLLMTASERAALTDAFIKGVDSSDDIDEGATNLLMTADERARLAALGTAGTPEFASINLGAAADTTLTRAGPGLMAIEGLTALTTATGLRSPALQVFTADGTYTPTADMKYCLIIGTGGGGGGGGADGTNPAAASGGGGGAGGTVIGLLTAAQIGSSRAVTIGAAGAAGTDSGGSGGSGGNTVLDTLLTANGGAGGTGATTTSNAEGGLGGAPSGATMNIVGGDGGTGSGAAIGGGSGDGRGSVGGHGGASFWGGGAKGVWTANGGSVQKAGIAGRCYGGGGGGAVCLNTTTGAAGGAGMTGVMMILEFV